MIRKYHNNKLQTNSWLHEDEPHSNHEFSGRQTKQSNQPSLLIKLVAKLFYLNLLLKHKHVELAYRNNIIKLTHYDETKKMVYDSQIVRANKNLKLSHVGSSYSQASGSNPPSLGLRPAIDKM